MNYQILREQSNHEKRQMAEQRLEKEFGFSQAEVDIAMNLCLFSSNHYQTGQYFNQYIFEGIITEVKRGWSIYDIETSVNNPAMNLRSE